MNKRVLISTFNNSLNNYGAVFQACALGKKIEEIGFEPVFLSLTNRNSYADLKKKKVPLKKKLKGFAAGVITKRFKKKKKERAVKFIDFVNMTQLQCRYRNYTKLEECPPKADVYLSGSDQVWNPKTLHKELMLAFAPDDAPLISYAASMGCEVVPKNNEETFKKYIQRYDFVSVREDTMADVIKKYTSKPIVQHIDPVFLMTRDQWVSMQKPYKELKFKKYILLYLIEFGKEDVRKVKELRNETGLPLVLVSLSGLKTGFADQVVLDASPEEFLSLLSGAEMVVASSFHGTALSIIFNKPFISVSGKDKPTRIESLLRHFDIEKQNNPERFTVQNARVNYEPINRKIEIDRKQAEEYLKLAISSGKQK